MSRRPPSKGPGASRRRGGASKRPGAAATSSAQNQERPDPASNENSAYARQLQSWAQLTSKRQLTDLEGEFERLQNLPRPEPSPEFVKNPTLNRYRDVPCLETGRVKLNSGHYIHANWIAFNGQQRYICTQGPLKNTVDDFWEMIVQERVDAIAMLCDTLEMNRPKCYQYWPRTDRELVHSSDGILRVSNLGTEELDEHLFKTRLSVKNTSTGAQVIVRHFHWRGWPDRGVPLNHLASLRLLFHLSRYERLVVHCSAGIGRTGTIVAIDLAQSLLRSDRPLDLYELVLELRRQRAGSVQTLDQYLYIYTVLLRYARSKAEKGRMQLNNRQTDDLIRAIATRIYHRKRR